MRPRRYIVAMLLAAAVSAAEVVPSVAQNHAFVPVGDWTYTFMERLQRRGYLLELNPTALPYTRISVRSALEDVDRRQLSDVERQWVDLLRSEFGLEATRASTLAGVAFDAGLRTVNGERLDVLRPEATADPTLPLGGINLYPNASLRGYLERGRLIAHAGARFDVYYRDDPDGLDAANRLITRNDETYIGYDGRFASVYLGRAGRHWGTSSGSALLVSHNAVSMDQLAFRIGGGRLAWRGFLGELDSATPDGRFTGAAGADSVGGSIRRYLAAHRVDWRPSRRFGLSVMEAALYSGPNASPSVKFLNPLLIHLFAVDGRPKNDENNGLVAGMLWAHVDRWTLTGQLMLDDVDILSESGEPISAALSGTLTYAGFPSADVGLAATIVTARAYNTHQPEGQYIYLNRGIATPFSDFVQISAFAPLFLDRITTGLTVTPRIDALWQGSRDFRQRYPTRDVGVVLDGTPERTIRTALEIHLQRHRAWWLRIDIGPNFVSDANHQEGASESRWTVFAEIGARLRLNRRTRLSF